MRPFPARFGFAAAALAGLLLSPPAVAASGPATRPATRPAGAGPRASILSGQLEFTPPAGWDGGPKAPAVVSVTYVSASRQGLVSLAVQPTDAKINAAAVSRQLLDSHKRARQAVFLTPTAEPDSRYDLRLHERYQQADKVADVLYLYRTLNGRIVLTTVASLAADPDEVKAIQAAGEAAADSAAWVKPKTRGRRVFQFSLLGPLPV